MSIRFYLIFLNHRAHLLLSELLGAFREPRRLLRGALFPREAFHLRRRRLPPREIFGGDGFAVEPRASISRAIRA